MTRHPRRGPVRVLSLLAALSLAVPGLVAGAASARQSTPSAALSASPIRLWAPHQLTAFSYNGRVWADLGLRAIAQGAAFELWSQRPSYDEQIRTTWRAVDGDVLLPEGSMKDFSGLHNFVRLSFRSVETGEVRRMYRPACFSGRSERVSPDAPATSGYPEDCWHNAYALGSVQGIQAGWAAPVLAQVRPIRLAPGDYTVTARITGRYARIFGIAGADATRVIDLRVAVDGDAPARPTRRSATPGPLARPAAHEPRRPAAGLVSDARPDLRSLPAWGIRTSPNGKYLQFAATVWNAGDSPLVVDGFRREGEEVMDAYQYFYDGGGNQTGYQQVGTMRWDAKPTHQHWHFEDFARYSLLDAGGVEVVRSHKEAFCLANTDSIDETVPNAEWRRYNSDLATACGDQGSLSIREVLASGWGDTYAQFRAGQSFNLRGLPNGKYFIAVIANPENRLVESSTDNNVALREVRLRGKDGARRVEVAQVGAIVEPNIFN